MTGLEIATLVLVVLVAFAWYLTYTAARLHRLHTRVEGTYAALDAQLVRRAEAVLEVANSGLMDPAGALILAGAATESLAAGETAQQEREGVESDLTRAIRLTVPRDQPVWEDHGHDEPDRDEQRVGGSRIGAPGGGRTGGTVSRGLAADMLDHLDSAGQRVMMARRFHNDAVVDVLRLRTNVFVRAFHLAGHTDLPRTVEFDDDHHAAG